MRVFKLPVRQSAAQVCRKLGSAVNIGLFVLVQGLGVLVAPAAILLNESFNYPDGPLVVAGSNVWTTFGGTASQITVAGGRANLNLADSEDVQALIEPSTDVVYAGFDISFTTLPNGAGNYFALFKDVGATAGFRARVWAFTNSAAGGKLRLGLSSTTSILNATNPTDLSLNTRYRVVLRVQNDTGAATLWIDPGTESDPSITTAEAASSSTVACFALRQPSSKGALSVDDLIVGESFAEVVSPNPPPAGPPLLTPYLSVLTYNAHGNAIPDWTTNSAQVRAIGRQVAYIDPDIITFQEIPMTNSGWAQMGNFVAAFRPGYYLATNSGDDGYIRSAILSRYPITVSKSWLAFADLKPFGYTNPAPQLADNFTRDLFEAQVAVPGFAQPLHVFTAHLKSGTGASSDAEKRAAEAAAVSNFFVNVFLPANASHPYLLTGDLNEDIAQPATGSQQPVQRLANAATGLHLTTPRNPVTGDHRTFSIRAVGGLSGRYDYILPGGLLYSNYAGSLVFRTDQLTNPPAPLLSNDDATASDHLPVLMYFANPYESSFRLLSVAVADGEVSLQWEAVSNWVYGVEVSTNLAAWLPLVSNLTATGTSLTFTTNAPAGQEFFRVYRVP
jgi:endonuclease/exonuclease/phosphatase family metal-dependent hydrolase